MLKIEFSDGTIVSVSNPDNEVLFRRMVTRLTKGNGLRRHTYHRRPFTAEDDEVIKAGFFSNRTAEEIAAQLGRTAISVSGRINKLDLRKTEPEHIEL